MLLPSAANVKPENNIDDLAAVGRPGLAGAGQIRLDLLAEVQAVWTAGTDRPRELSKHQMDLIPAEGVATFPADDRWMKAAIAAPATPCAMPLT